MRISLRQLAVFEAVARLGSLVRAAAEIGLSPSAASMSLKDFEDHLEARLFDRQGKRLILNDHGRQVREMASSILAQVADLEAMTSPGELRGALRIGAAPAVGDYVLPQLCGDFMAAHPGIRVDLNIIPSLEVMDRVRKMSIDIGFVGAPVNSPYLEATPWLRDPLVVCCAPGSRLATGGEISLIDLKDERWILEKTASSERISFTVETLKHVSSINIALESDSIEAIKRIVRGGDFIACLSRLAVEEEVRRGEIHVLNVPELNFTRLFSVVNRPEVYQSQAFRAFRDFALTRFSETLNDEDRRMNVSFAE